MMKGNNMRKSIYILILISFASTCFAGGVTDKVKSVIARKNAAAGSPQTETIYPTVDGGSYNTSVAQGGGDKYVEVDDAVGAADDDTTYIYRADAAFTQGFDTYPAITSSSITNVIIYYRCKEIGGNAFAMAFLRVNGTKYVQAGQALTTSYGDFSYTWATNPNTTVAWTEADVKGTGAAPIQEWGIDSTGLDPGETVRCTQCYMVVNYVD